jgi:Domain of unknown function (DUF4281)
MTPAAWFSIANPVALLGWLALAVALWASPPWRPRLLALGGRALPIILAVGYLAALIAHWGSAPGGGFGTLDEVAALFRSPGLLLAGWVHYLAFDLFVGRWIVDDALARGLPRLAVLPCLLLTFLFGPVGLLLHFAARAAIGSKEPQHGF